jgi:hypothetical protein
LKSGQLNGSQDRILNKVKKSQKRAGRLDQGISPEFKSKYHKKGRKKNPLSFDDTLPHRLCGWESQNTLGCEFSNLPGCCSLPTGYVQADSVT